VHAPLPSATGLLFHKEGRHATWLELFFDLVFVAAISVVTHNLLGVHDKHLDHGHAWLYPLEIIPVWWIWASQTLFDNRFDTDSRGNRLVSLVIMLLVATMATLLGGGWADQTGLFIGIAIQLPRAAKPCGVGCNGWLCSHPSNSSELVGLSCFFPKHSAA